MNAPDVAPRRAQVHLAADRYRVYIYAATGVGGPLAVRYARTLAGVARILAEWGAEAV